MLWLLRPIFKLGEVTAWDPWYDKALGFVVRASTEEEARELATGEAGDEDPWWLDKSRSQCWLDPEQSTCVPLDHEGPAEVIICDFKSA